MAAKQRKNSRTLSQELTKIQLALCDVILTAATTNHLVVLMETALKGWKVEGDKVILPLTPELLSLLKREETGKWQNTDHS